MASGLRPGTVDRGRLPVQQRDRRAALSALALLLVVAGALGSALAVYRSGHRTDVLVAAHEIKPGQQVTSADFTIARVASDSSGHLIPAASRANFNNTYALTDIPAGTLLNSQMFLAGALMPADGVIVGVVLPANQRPAVTLSQGEVVRVYQIPKSAGTANQQTSGVLGAPATTAPATGAAAGTTAKVLVDSARVVEVQSGSSESGLTVSLLLKPADAQAVVLAAAAGEIAVGRLSTTIVPGIDLKSAAPAATPAAVRPTTPAPATS